MESIVKFLLELDKLKLVYRQSYVTGLSRNENSAEHSWHLALALLTLKDELNLEVNILKALKMALIHDVCEIDAGDISIYSPDRDKKTVQERACINRISQINVTFSSELAELWEEYEAQESIESKWVKVVDRLLPFIVNLNTGGKTWREMGISKSQVIEVNQHIQKLSPEIFNWILSKIDEAVEKEWLIDA